MFIMNKKRTCIVKVTAVFLRDSKIEKNKVDIFASDCCNDEFLLGTYDAEYASKELESIYTTLSLSDSIETYKMPSDLDVEKYYTFKRKLEDANF